MLICLLFFILSPVCFWFNPALRLARLSEPAHQICQSLVPISPYQNAYQALLCGEKISTEVEIIKNSGMIHLFVIFGFQIYLIDRASRLMFHKKILQNLFALIAVFAFLWLTAFHPAGLRAAIALLLREISTQQKLFWSPLQVSIFSGFLCLAVAPHLIDHYSLLIGWTASMSFGFFMRHHPLVKNSATYLCLLPLLWGLAIPHPLLALSFSFLSRPILFALLPLCILCCCSTLFLEFGEQFWKLLFAFAEQLTHIFLPLYLGRSGPREPFAPLEDRTRPDFFAAKLSLLQIWIYLLGLIFVFLFFENRRLRRK